MTDRDRIFEAVRAAVGRKQDRAALPDLPLGDLVSETRLDGGGWERFRVNFEAVNGDFLGNGDALRELLRREGARLGYCPPELRAEVEPWLPEEVRLVDAIDRRRIDDYGFGISRASLAIAETGTLVLTDRETPDRLGALAPWAHVAVVSRGSLVPTVVDAIQALPDDPNVVWVTGPSKTADVEGILIEGVHGPGVQACLVVD
jgi:L-lactate dehydrogenase complex protein LldG